MFWKCPHFLRLFSLHLLLLLLLLLASASCRPTPQTDQAEQGRGMIETYFPERQARIGPQACVECHAYEVEQWEKSDHAHANRVASDAFVPAFTGNRSVVEGRERTEPRYRGSTMVMRYISAVAAERAGDGGADKVTVYPVDGILGRRPLWQPLVPTADGRWQVTSAAYDPANEEWFDIFEGQGRESGEWGHWQGQGMNWNANCAYCHMTDFHKNLDQETFGYASTWLQQGIACAQCHTGLEEHLEGARSGNPLAGIQTLSKVQIEQSCATCHSRRQGLTEEAFQPGDHYADHFSLSLPDQEGLYYPDGQIRDEVFVYGSFRMSRMGHAGVSCADCHLVHSQELSLKASNNMLCQRCHESGLDGATIIDPLTHSRHPAGSTGNLCVECHMPHTTYMARDPRRDHGFLSPDPLMTRELGIPNACSECHQDQSLDWVIEAAEDWYGEKLEQSDQRKRARAFHAAYARDPEGLIALKDLIADEDVAEWKATYLGLLGQYLADPEAIQLLQSHLSDSNVWVRQRAVTSLSPHPEATTWLADALEDPRRTVRISAAQAFVGAGAKIEVDSLAAKDWAAYLEFNSDQPSILLYRAMDALAKRSFSQAYRLLDQAIEYDKKNPGVYREAATLVSGSGDLAQAERYLNRGLEIAPDSALLLYSLALLAAEQGQTPFAEELLQQAVESDPAFYRAWLNLSVIHLQAQEFEASREALEQSRPGEGGSPLFQQVEQFLMGVGQ